MTDDERAQVKQNTINECVEALERDSVFMLSAAECWVARGDRRGTSPAVGAFGTPMELRAFGLAFKSAAERIRILGGEDVTSEVDGDEALSEVEEAQLDQLMDEIFGHGSQ